MGDCVGEGIVHDRFLSLYRQKMESDEDGGEHTNAMYYQALWNKALKVRYEWKRAKVSSPKQGVSFSNQASLRRDTGFRDGKKESDPCRRTPQR
jgi:hypothetical protein